MGDTKLECPHCHYTIELEKWNEELRNSIKLGRAEELIPSDLLADQWESYALEHGGSVDCPECGEVCVFDDMTAY